jgi:hypothetical protein
MTDSNNNKTEADLERVYQSQSNSKTFVSEHFGTICQLLLNRQSSVIARALLEPIDGE